MLQMPEYHDTGRQATCTLGLWEGCVSLTAHTKQNLKHQSRSNVLAQPSS